MIDQKDIRRKLSPAARQEQGTHAGLWLDKYIRDQSRSKENSSRRDLVNDVATLPDPSIYSTYFVRWKEMLHEYHAQTRRVKVKGRMAVGLGSESVLETSISLHRTYGVPYIPGSALKGLAASYAHHRLGDEWSRGGKFYTVVFGDTDKAGFITFFDALYLPGTGHNGRPLAPDVITVHHQHYYQGTSDVPADSDNPNPIPFLSATGTYLLALAAPDIQSPTTRWLDITFQILAEALATLGIGAKTSSGYGRMEFIDPPAGPVDPEMQRAEERKRAVIALREAEMKRAEGYKQEVTVLKVADVAGQIYSFYQRWQQLTTKEARTLLATAIIEKVREAKREKATAEKAWYKELQAFLSAN